MRLIGEIKLPAAYEFIELESLDEFGLVEVIPVPVESINQRRIAPDTPDEICTVWNGHCPVCGDKLAGDNNLFCVRDQIWWEPPRL